MSDLIKALEADLYGAYEWAADLYEELKDVPEPVERALIAQGLFRAYENLEGRDEDAGAASGFMAEAEDAVPADIRGLLASVIDAREPLLDAEDTTEQAETLAPRFLAAFESAWADPEHSPRESLVADGIIAALLHGGMLSGRKRGGPTGDATAAKDEYRKAAELYSAVATLLEARVQKGGILWQETARSAWFRARSQWRAAGDDMQARMAEDAARGLGAGQPEASAIIAGERKEGKVASDDVKRRLGRK